MLEGVSQVEAESLRFAALTDVGRERGHNEDNFLMDRRMSLFLVCDGMGGHAAGEVASAMAVRAFHEELKASWDLVEDFRQGKRGAERVTRREIMNMLEFAVNRASMRVHEAAKADDQKRGMGTTLIGVLVVGKEAFIVHVGDSRLYLLRSGAIEQVTEDHNVMNELLKRKKMTREQVEKLPQRNAVTRAVGVYEHVEPDTLVLDLAEGDRLLLCSDGLSMYFEDDLEGLGQLLRVEDENDAVKGLVERANELGGKDNITAVVVSVVQSGAGDDRLRKLALRRKLLARTPLFRPLNDREILRVLQVTTTTQYQDGDVVMREGETGDELFIVLSGKIQVRHGDSVIATLSAGEHVGEMALIRSQPRSATVQSEGTSELMVIRRADFFDILRKEHQLAVKLLWQFTGVLADRLAATNRELSVAKEGLGDAIQEIYPEDEDDDRKTLIMLPPLELGDDG
ncbi:MAG: Stp1/IreP family PP2C-type Ser/Thr phosphatase [Polyangiaceae bacterium]|nr:Stp1/IreP family PP2C-type Ser/Thr phosphatase [Polyangiaceae bacterium]MCW5788961.1 Stp1/IreP family PP2C-type Ser/Thr phosphatase [Polyangiaceae bacterium]